jgi:transmembrane sensor
MDELLTRARNELEPPWDDVREARVLSRVLDEASLTRQPLWRRPMVGLGGFLAVAAAAAAMFLFLRAPPAPRVPPAPTVTLAAPPSRDGTQARSRETPSVLALADGSKAHLQPGAEVQTLEQSARLVRLMQARGVVRYDVKPDAERAFTIAAPGVEVRVIGTVFTVAVEDDAVRVSVERGRVAVKSGTRAVELSPGENVRLSRDDPSTSAEPEGVPERRASPEVAKTGPDPVAGAAQSPATLMQEADAARAKGDLAKAERLLARLLAEHQASPQATSAAFSLGRIQRARGNFGAAARTFEGLRRRAPAGPLAEDALAESANAWALAGDAAQARRRAAEYTASYPQGPHAERMRRLSAP